MGRKRRFNTSKGFTRIRFISVKFMENVLDRIRYSDEGKFVKLMGSFYWALKNSLTYAEKKKGVF